jgi:hypothetical protein
LGPSFGTFRTLPKEEIVYGIDTHMKNEEHNELKNLLKILSKQRSEKNYTIKKKSFYG